jgi:hypothetical protein
VQERVLEVDLIPAKVQQFGRAQAVPKGNKHHRGIAVTPTVALHGLDQPPDLALS